MASVSRARCHLQEGLQIVPGLRIGRENAKELQAGQKQSQKMAGASVMALHSEVGDRKPASDLKCYRCNSTQHLARDCRLKAAVSCLWQNRPHCKGLPQQGQHSEQRVERQEALPWFGPTHTSTDC